MSEIFSISSSSRTHSFPLSSVGDHSSSSAAYLLKGIPLKDYHEEEPLKRRKTLKLKAKPLDDNPQMTLKSIQNNPTKKVSLKRKIIKVIEDLEKVKYKPKNLIKDQKVFQERIRLFDMKKKINFNFRCFKEDELGYKNEVTKMIISTKQDNDVETDDETLSYYVKKCQKDIMDAISAEKKSKEIQREKMKK